MKICIPDHDRTKVWKDWFSPWWVTKSTADHTAEQFEAARSEASPTTITCWARNLGDRHPGYITKIIIILLCALVCAIASISFISVDMTFQEKREKKIIRLSHFKSQCGTLPVALCHVRVVFSVINIYFIHFLKCSLEMCHNSQAIFFFW